MGKIKLDLASTRLAFILIALLLLLITLSALIPQRDIADDQILDWREALGDNYKIIEQLGLDRIYITPPLFIVLGLLAVNLVAGNLRRFRIVLRTEKTLLRVRHLSSILFHFSLLVIMVGAILNFLFKSYGIFGLTEGQTAADSVEQYFRVFDGPLAHRPDNQFEVTLRRIDPGDDSGIMATGSAELMLHDLSQGEKSSGTISISHPLTWGDLEFHLGDRIGYSPELLVTGEDGRHIFRSFVRLSVNRKEKLTTHEDFVILPEDGTRIGIALYPGSPSDMSPTLSLVVERDGMILHDGATVLGDTVRVDTLLVSIPRLRRWCYIEVLRNPFISTIFTGFWTCLAGLAFSVISHGTRNGRETA